MKTLHTIPITMAAVLMLGVVPGRAQISIQPCCVYQYPGLSPATYEAQVSVPQEGFVAVEFNDCEPKHNQDGLYFTRSTTSSACWANAAVFLPADMVPKALSCHVTDTSASTYVMARLKKRVAGATFPKTIFGLADGSGHPAAQSYDTTGLQTINYYSWNQLEPMKAATPDEAWLVTVTYYRTPGVPAGANDADRYAKLHHCTVYR